MASPLLYQMPARDWLARFDKGRGATARSFERITDTELDRIAAWGFDWLYLLGVWQTGQAGRRISLANAAWQPGYRRALSSFDESAVSGSPFAIAAYEVHGDFGGNEALASLRERLHSRGMRLMLDYVPNHVAIDHAWTVTHPERLMRGTDEDLQREPDNYLRVGKNVFAYGRDPYFPGWVDTVQLDYSNAETQAAMAGELSRIAGQCDGLRCDMAMLILPQIFERTWGKKAAPFWPDAIAKLRAANPDFTMMAEVYWGMEWELQQQGFDYAYDKTLYDRLLGEDAGPVRDHLRAPVEFQSRLARFLENHDEPRIAEELPWARHRAAALVAYSLPGLRFFHDGQLEGARRKPSVHLGLREREQADEQVLSFYRDLIPLLRRYFTGDWRLVEASAAWEGNHSHRGLIAGEWRREGKLNAVVIVNFSGGEAQGYLHLDVQGLAETITFADPLTDDQYERPCRDVAERGLYVALPAWGAHLFRVCG